MAGIHGRGVRTRGARAAGAAAALLLLTACSGGSGDGGGEEAGLEMGASGVMPAVEPPGPEGFTTQTVEGITIDVPEGWGVQNEGGTMCASPPGQDACSYGSIQLTPRAAQGNPDDWPKKGDAHTKDDGWAHDTGSCRSLNTAASGGIGVSGAELKVSDFTTHANELKSHHSVWQVTCANDDTFEVRMWFLPISDVLLYVWSADSQYSSVYDQVAASMNTDGYSG
ncbi:hypothetical protein ACFVWN_26595 [Nocardiopsis flavescens]|uniref:DUF3558 domain-containing protein n=1 Tax=Nocardiopsis flavescens TaxID=758803 RepID=A0A1M6UK98_9ACTN|nr:hypothetical protein [Nocardiopsis flavescens]SHK69611.1 hypothetical protein SAMN05421803_12841 [Nocardiopsis flavescens]